MVEPLYKRKDVPVDVRVEDLLSRMTLEEKVAQLGSVGPLEILDEQGNLDPEKAAQAMPHGIGQVARIAGASACFPRRPRRLPTRCRSTYSPRPAWVFPP